MLTLEVKVPALLGHLHIHVQELVEVLLKLLVVDWTKEVPPHRRALQLNALLHSFKLHMFKLR